MSEGYALAAQAWYFLVCALVGWLAGVLIVRLWGRPR